MMLGVCKIAVWNEVFIKSVRTAFLFLEGMGTDYITEMEGLRHDISTRYT